MNSSVLSNTHDFIVQKCAINGLDLDDMLRQSGMSSVAFSVLKAADPLIIKLLKKLIDTIDENAGLLRAKHEVENTLYAGHEIRTYTGKYVNVFDPKPEMFCLEDIAHGLSRKARWGGHSQSFISVAEHSCNVAERCSWENKKAALFHDASEAYISDIPSPIKALLPEYKVLEDRVMDCIAEKFGFDWPMNKEVKWADAEELNGEWHNYVLAPGPEITMNTSRERFLNLYYHIYS